MFSINFSRFAGMATKKVVTASSMLAMLFAFANVNAQTTFTFNPENFLIPPSPSVTECTGDACGGEIFLRMGTPVIEGGNASIGIWLRVESALGDTVPYLGNYTFHVATGGPGITLGRTECSFELAEGVQSDYAPAGLPVGTTDPFSITVSGVAPGFGIRPPSDDSHYTLKTEFEQFGTFSCPVANENGVNAYILAPSNVFGFTIQAGGGDQRQLLLRAANSFRYYPLNGEPAYDVPANVVDGLSGDGAMTNLQITNNLPGVTATVTFDFAPGCGTVSGADNGPLADGVSNIPVTFDPPLSAEDCSVVYTITGPDGGSQEFTQVIYISAPPEPEDFRRDSLANYTNYVSDFVSASGIMDPPGVVAGDFVDTVIMNNAVQERGRASFTAVEVQTFVEAEAIAGIRAEDMTGIGISSPRVLTNVLSFAATVADATSTLISFVIDVRDGDGAGLATATRLVKQLSDANWRGVNNGAGGSVSHLGLNSGVDPGCPSYPAPADSVGTIWVSTASTDTAIDGVIPAGVTCVVLTIADGGIYDADAETMGRISDPFVAVENHPDINLAHSGGRPGGGGNGFLGIGSAGAWTIMALLTVLGLSMLRRRRVTVRSEL